jgi:hypothetical protein
LETLAAVAKEVSSKPTKAVHAEKAKAKVLDTPTTEMAWAGRFEHYEAEKQPRFGSVRAHLYKSGSTVLVFDKVRHKVFKQFILGYSGLLIEVNKKADMSPMEQSIDAGLKEDVPCPESIYVRNSKTTKETFKRLKALLGIGLCVRVQKCVVRDDKRSQPFFREWQRKHRFMPFKLLFTFGTDKEALLASEQKEPVKRSQPSSQVSEPPSAKRLRGVPPPSTSSESKLTTSSTVAMKSTLSGSVASEEKRYEELKNLLRSYDAGLQGDMLREWQTVSRTLVRDVLQTGFVKFTTTYANRLMMAT